MKIRLLLIDLTDCLYQQWHLAGKPENIDDEFVHNLSSRLLKFSQDLQPTHIMPVADAPTSWRENFIKNYKFHGNTIPFPIYKSLGRVEKQLTELGWSKVIRKKDTEAVDIIWKILESTNKSESIRRKVISSDKRLLKWAGPITTLEPYWVRYETGRNRDEHWIEFKYGVKPKQINDFLALAGNQSIGLKGVPGIGPKIASDLLNSYDSIEGIIDNLDNIKGKIADNIRTKENLFIERDLNIGKDGVDLNMSMKDIKVSLNNNDQEGITYI